MEALLITLAIASLSAAWAGLFLAILATRKAGRAEEEARASRRELDAELFRLRRLADAEVGAGVVEPEPAPLPEVGPRPAPATDAEIEPARDREVEEEAILASSLAAPPPVPPAASAPAEPITPIPPSAPTARETPPRPALEERIGARLFVWIGAVALTLAGVFMVRYFAEQGLLGPEARVLCTAGFGVALIGAAQWLRGRAAQVAQGAAAAGVAVLYAAILAASQLYQLIGAAPAMAGMAVVTAAAVVLSLRHGPFVALLGLVGGFLTPALIGVREFGSGQLFGFLLLLEIGLAALTRSRRWWWLLALTAFGGLGWAAYWLAAVQGLVDEGKVSFFVFASVLLFVGASFQAGEERLGRLPVRRAVPWFTVVLGAVLIAWQVEAGGFAPAEWVYLGLLGAGTIALAELRDGFRSLPVVAAVLSLVLLLVWVDASSSAGAVGPCLGLVLPFGLLYGLGGWLGMRREEQRLSSACLCATAPLAALLVAWLELRGQEWMLPWWASGVLTAAALGGAMVPMLRRREALALPTTALAAPFLGGLAALAAAAAMEWGGVDLSIAWALLLPLAMLLRWKLGLPELRWAALALAALVGLRLFLNPAMLEQPLPAEGWWCWIQPGFGVPLVAAGLAAWFAGRAGDAGLCRGFTGAALLCYLALTGVLVHAGHYPGQTVGQTEPQLQEDAWIAVVWLLSGLAAAWLPRLPGLAALRLPAVAPSVLGFAGAGLVSFAALLPWNPLTTDPGWSATPLWNGRLAALALPAALAAAAAWTERRRGRPEPANAFALFAAVLGLLWASFEIRGLALPEGMLAATGVGLLESGLLVTLWLGAGAALPGLAGRLRPPALRPLGAGVLGLGLVASPLLFGFGANPLAAPIAVGELPVLNLLLPSLGLPCAAAAVAAWACSRLRWRAWAGCCGLVSLLLAFALLSLEVRQAFQGARLDLGPTSEGEWYAYSAAWILFGAGLLAGGMAARLRLLRLASLAVVLLSVAKVFLFDLRHLEDLWRVGSFLGLGASLLGLAWIYQKWVFGQPAEPSE